MVHKYFIQINSVYNGFETTIHKYSMQININIDINIKLWMPHQGCPSKRPLNLLKRDRDFILFGSL